MSKINSQDFLNLIVKGGSPGQHTPGWDKGWPPKPKPQPKIAQRDPLAELNRGLIDQSTFEALKSTSPHLFVDDGTLPNVPIGPQPGTDPLTGMPIDTVQGLPAVGNMLGIQVAGMPRYISGVAPPPGVINKAPHIDSRYIDEQIRRRWQPIQLTAPGPQLPGFV